MKILSKIILSIIIVCCFSCEDRGLIVKCSDCLSEEPIDAELNIKVGSNHSSIETIINVYEGNIEDSVLYSTLKTVNQNAYIKVTLNKKYTVTATYKEQNDLYVAIDSATPRVRFEKSQCDKPCYFVYDNDVDLRLKYTN
jgi:ribosome-associated translation inhibitor RaiA